MRIMIVMLMLSLILSSFQCGTDDNSASSIFQETPSLIIVEVPASLDTFDRTIVALGVVVMNNRSESTNVTLVVEQDRSPHQAVPVGTPPSMIIPSGSNGTLPLQLMAMVSYDDLTSEEWTGRVTTSVFIRALAVDDGELSAPVMIEVNISFFRDSYLLSPTLLAIVILFLAVITFHRQRRLRRNASSP